MPSYISHLGMCFPGKERVGLKNTTEKVKKPSGKCENPEDEFIIGQDIEPGQDYIYEGPDRAATEELKKAGEAFFGQDFRHDLEFKQVLRQNGFDDVESYLHYIMFDAEEVEKKFQENMGKIKTHQTPTKREGTKFRGGGIDTAGSGHDKAGNFGDPPPIGT